MYICMSTYINFEYFGINYGQMRCMLWGAQAFELNVSFGVICFRSLYFKVTFLSFKYNLNAGNTLSWEFLKF